MWNLPKRENAMGLHFFPVDYPTFGGSPSYLISTSWLLVSSVMRGRYGALNRHKYLLAAVLAILVLYNSLPAVKSTLNPRAEQSENRPRYLHQSTFRADPDYDYEATLSNALRAIEVDPKVDHDATDTIWQIILSSKDHRKDDSYELESRNPEWKYQVCRSW